MRTPVYLHFAMRFSFLILTSFILSSCYRQQVVIDQVPLNTPQSANIYITGNFNNWDPGDERFRMTRDTNGFYSTMLPRGVGKLDYKFTRGDWTSGEKNECGYEIDNRTMIYGENETVVNHVACWGDTEPMNCKQTVIVINEFPKNTPEEADIYLASQFNNWNPGDFITIMKKHPNGFYYLNIDRMGNCMDFKFTLGDWSTVETDGKGKDIDNRRFCFDGTDTLLLKVNEWKSISYRKTGSVTIIIDKLPEPAKAGEPIYITGDFNNWNPGDPGYIFHNDEKGRPALTLITDMEFVNFKITRGNWTSVETLPSGKDIPNRTHINGQNDTIRLKIERWKDR